MSFQTHETIQRLWETFLREQLDRLPPEERQAYEVQFEQRLGDLSVAHFHCRGRRRR